MPDNIEVEVRLGDTILEISNVARGRHRIAGVEIDVAAGELRHAGHRVAIAETWVGRASGVVEIRARRAAAPRKHALQPSHVDRRALGYVAISLAVHLVVWGLAEREPVEAPPEKARLVVRTPVRLQPQPGATPALPWARGDSPDRALPGGGQPTTGAEAKAGGESPRDRGHASIARRDRPRITREAAIETARNAGILGASSLASPGFAALVGSADPASGFDDKDVQAPLYGGTGEAAGRFGLGRSGFATSAGCDGGGCDGIIGTGRYGTISNGESIGDRWGGYRTGAGGLPDRRRAGYAPTVIICASARMCVIGVGGLDKAIIRRYVRRQLAQLQYCFEKELLAHRELEGTVETEFLIQPDGSVHDVSATGVSTEVSRCVARVIERIVFPRHGQVSSVRYPFTYRPR